MHLIVMIQETMPGIRPDTTIGKFVTDMQSKKYDIECMSKEWSCIRPRKIEFYDFIIPESIEEDVLERLSPYTGGKMQKLTKLSNIPILKNIIEKTLKIKPVDMEKVRFKVKEEGRKKGSKHQVYVTIMGKVEDGYNDKGDELL